MQNNPRLKVYVWGILVALFALAAVLASRTANLDLHEQDIYYNWLEGARLAQGENPYSRIHASDMLSNDKYATYFPLFYELSYLTNQVGLDEFATWVGVWRVIFLFCDLAIGALIFLLFYRRGLYALAIFAAAFWLFNRWTLYALALVHLDFLAILFFVLSLWLLPKRKPAAFLLFGVSLAIKQIAVFALPLYLIWAWQMDEEDPKRETLSAVALIGAVPLLSALPFIVWDISGLLKSVIFSATRLPDSHLGVYSVDTFLGLTGLPARLPLLAFLLLVYVLAWQKKLGRYMAAFLAMLVFVEFNTVFFNQYMVWVMALLPLVLFEYVQRSQRLKAARV